MGCTCMYVYGAYAHNTHAMHACYGCSIINYGCSMYAVFILAWFLHRHRAHASGGGREKDYGSLWPAHL